MSEPRPIRPWPLVASEGAQPSPGLNGSAATPEPQATEVRRLEELLGEARAEIARLRAQLEEAHHGREALEDARAAAGRRLEVQRLHIQALEMEGRRLLRELDQRPPRWWRRKGREGYAGLLQDRPAPDKEA